MLLHSPKGYASKEILKSLEESKAIAKFRRQPCEESRKDFFFLMLHYLILILEHKCYPQQIFHT